MKGLLLFTFNVSLKIWDNTGILEREVALYKKFFDFGINYKFFTYGDNTDLKYRKILKNIEIIPALNYLKSNNFVLKIINSFFLPVKLKMIFKNVDFIKTNQLFGSWVGVVAKILYKKKLVIRAGFEGYRNFKDRIFMKKIALFQFIKSFLMLFFIFINELITYKLADRIIFTSKSDIDFIIKTFRIRKKEKITLIPNFVDVDLFKNLKLEKKDKNILFIGRLSSEKNLTNLILAIKNLKIFILDIVGNGPYRKIFNQRETFLNNNVNFLGVIPNKKLPEIINQYQIFILPSIFECNPKALLEVMSCGVPCIATNVRGINEIITHKENGYLCETSVKSISEAVINLYKNEDLRRKIGRNARKFIAMNYSLEKIANTEFVLYKRLFKKK